MPTRPQLLDSSTPYEGSFFKVVVDTLRMPNGSMSRYETVEHPGAVAVVPLGADGRILMVRQRRHAVNEELLEIPAGKLEPGEDPQDCAARELEEETGYSPEHLELLVTCYSTPGFSNERVHVFLAESLKQQTEPPTHDGSEPITIEWLDPNDAVPALLDGRVVDGKSIIGIALMALRKRSLERGR